MTETPKTKQLRKRHIHLEGSRRLRRDPDNRLPLEDFDFEGLVAISPADDPIREVYRSGSTKGRSI